MTTPRSRINDQVLAEANAWLIDFEEREVDRAGRQEFNAWLRRSPEHVQAFLQATAFWEEAGLLKQRPGLDVEALMARALEERNIVPLDTPILEPSRKPRVRDTHWLGIAASVIAAVALGALIWLGLRAPTYATGIGEQRSIVLEDGSTVELNARSRLSVRFTDDERTIALMEGQALFAVAKDAARPFVVSAGNTRVRAVGTQFDIYRKRTGTVVTVVEGRVAVTSSSRGPAGSGSSIPDVSGAPRSTSSPGSGVIEPLRPPDEVLLAAGERLTITPTEITAPKPIDVAVAMAWTEKKLVFDATPLREVVEEFNRYNHRQLVIRDPELYDYHVSGVFPSTDPGRMVAFLRQRFGVTTYSSRDEIEITRQLADRDFAE